MTIDIFLLKTIISFIVGVIWITLITIIAERLGTKIGGAIAGIPATIVITLFFIGWTQNPMVASEATTIIPAILGINIIFTISYILLARKNHYISLIVSLIIWFLLAYYSTLHKVNFTNSLISYVITLIISYFILEKRLHIIQKEEKAVGYKKFRLLFRALVAGIVIASSVVLTKISGPLVGGVFATFPALTVALIIIVHKTQSKGFLESLLKNFIILGTINVAVYVIIIKYLYVYTSLVIGTLIAFLISLISAYFTYTLIARRMK